MKIGYLHCLTNSRQLGNIKNTWWTCWGEGSLLIMCVCFNGHKHNICCSGTIMNKNAYIVESLFLFLFFFKQRILLLVMFFKLAFIDTCVFWQEEATSRNDWAWRRESGWCNCMYKWSIINSWLSVTLLS